MKTWISKAFKGSSAALLLMIFLVACQDDSLTSQQTIAEQAKITAQDNAQIVISTQEALDVTAGAMQSQGLAAGRAMGEGGESEQENEHEDDDDCKPAIEMTVSTDLSHADTLIYKGKVTLDYGDGSTCEAEHKKTGKVINEFVITVSLKEKGAFKSVETITFVDFTRDSTTHNGSIVITSANGKKTTVEGDSVKLTYSDGTSSSWSGKYEFSYQDAFKKNGTLSVTGAITGTSREGVDFTATITKALEFKHGCFGKKKKIPVSGTIKVEAGSITTTIDYGDGTCDKEYTIEVNGEVTTHTFDKKKDS